MQRTNLLAGPLAYLPLTGGGGTPCGPVLAGPPLTGGGGAGTLPPGGPTLLGAIEVLGLSELHPAANPITTRQRSTVRFLILTETSVSLGLPRRA